MTVPIGRIGVIIVIIVISLLFASQSSNRASTDTRPCFLVGTPKL